MKGKKQQNALMCYLIMLLFADSVLTSPLCQSQHNTAKESFECGLNPHEPRIFHKYDRPQTSQVILAAAYRQGSGSRIFIARATVKGSVGYPKQPYFSLDHCNSWLRDTHGITNYGNLVSFNHMIFTGIMDGNNRNLLWRSKKPTGIVLSLNGGQSWEEISPIIDRKGEIEQVELLGAGKHDEGTLYAGIRLSVNGGDYAVYRSHDYGRSFSMVSNQVLYAVESAVKRNLMIGVGKGEIDEDHEIVHHAIVVSEDAGITWKKTQSDIVLDRVEGHGYNARPVRQIESDPLDSDIFYVLTWTGIYATRNWGKTFKLLPLAVECIGGVDQIAVDPLDGRYIYAVVKGVDFYRSSDKGCTWEKLKLPDLP